MMSPSLVVDDEGLVLAAGAAGGTRLRPALVQVLCGILDEGLDPQAAVDRPRLHSAGEIVRLEPGFDDDTLLALADAGYDVRRFDRSTTTSAGSACLPEPEPRPIHDGAERRWPFPCRPVRSAGASRRNCSAGSRGSTRPSRWLRASDRPSPQPGIGPT